MAAPILPIFFSQFVYPAILTGFGLVGNVYILGGQIKEMKDDLGGLIKEIKSDIKEMKGDIKEMKGDIKDTKNDIKGLLARQTELELQDMALAQKLLKDCGKNK